MSGLVTGQPLFAIGTAQADTNGKWEFAKTADPTSSDNFAAGYKVGSRWFNTIANRVWDCIGDGVWNGGGAISVLASLAGCYSTTAPSTSTITMTVDKSALLCPGMPIRFLIGSTYYYAQIVSITSSLMTIRGAPLTTGSGDILELAFGPSSMVQQIHVLIPGAFEASTLTTLLSTFAKDQFKWKGGYAYCVGFDYIVDTADGGGTQPNINVLWGGNRVSTANSGAGPLVSTSWQKTGIDIHTTYYAVTNDTVLEIECTKGTNGDAANLSIEIIMICQERIYS